MRWFCSLVTALLLATGCRGTHRCDDGFRFDESGDCVSADTCPGGRDPVTGRCAEGGDAGEMDGGASDGGDDAGPTQCERPLDCDDGVFCNGIELCDPTSAMADPLGCVAAADMRCLASQTCDEDMDRCQTMCDIDPDADGDGVNAIECGGMDCDDADMDRFPGNTEVCDLLDHDEDCDPSTFGIRDGDGDGAPDAACCNVDTDGATLICGTDCDDGDMAVNPGATELCNMVDDDCDSMTDEGAGASCVLSETMVAACTAGACVPTACNSGFGNCDADDANGCEQDTDSSDAHCGMCGNVCGECETCSGGSCVPATDGGSCMAGSGQCRAGACCTGCWDGSTCQPGTVRTACGGGGGLCESCPCASDTCTAAACAPAGGGVVDFDVGDSHACALLADGRLYCWGRNREGQLGVGDLVDRSTPAPVLPGTMWRDVDVGDLHSCALDPSNRAFCWGQGTEGQLGGGDLMNRNIPTVIVAGSLYSDIRAGRHTCALLSGAGGGPIYCWGDSFGTTPSLAASSTPSPYVALDVAEQQGILLAVRAPGTYWRSDFGAAMGQEGAATNWVDVEGAHFGACLINSGGELWCWGEIGTVTYAGPLSRVGTAANWETVSATSVQFCGIRSGELWCAAATGAPPPISRVGARSDWNRARVNTMGYFATRRDGTLWVFTGNPVATSASRVCF